MKNIKGVILTCKDYTVSGEKFDLILDDKKDMLITSPQPKEIDLPKYYESEAYISHSDANTTLFDKVYQEVKNFTIKQKIKLINSLGSETQTILDIGCGTGDFLYSCKQNDWKIFGIEPNKGARDLAVNKTEGKIHIDIKAISEADDLKFDVITMWHVLEHIPNLEEYIKTLKKILKHNGTLIIAVPNYKSHDAAYYGKYWAAYDVPRHLWHFSQIAIKKLFAKVDLRVANTLPMKFDAYYVSLLSEKYKSGKSNLVPAMFRGFVSNIKAFRNKEYSSLIYILKN